MANVIYTRLVKNTGLKGRGVKKTNWTVITQNTVPAVLVEGGFMDNKSDHAFITSAAGQTAYAKAVAEGLIEFLGLTKKSSTKTVYRVQTGAFRNKANATNLLSKIKAAKFDAYVTMADGYYKVQIGAFTNKTNANNMVKKLKAAGFDSCIATTNSSAAVPT